MDKREAHFFASMQKIGMHYLREIWCYRHSSGVFHRYSDIFGTRLGFHSAAETRRALNVRGAGSMRQKISDFGIVTNPTFFSSAPYAHLPLTNLHMRAPKSI